jgi:hypothetical protein
MPKITLQKTPRTPLWSRLAFLLWWIPALYFDSSYSTIVTGHWLTLLAAIILFVVQYRKASLRLRLLMWVMIPLSYLGEVLCTEVLGLYHYRLGTVPFYIPIGHAVVYAAAYQIFLHKSLRNFFQNNRFLVLTTYALAFIAVLLLFGDTLSALMGALLFLMLIRKRNHTIYLIIGLVVLYLELIGTQLGNWSWTRQPGIFSTTNPPLGSIMIYVGGDALLNKLVRKGIGLRRQF